MKDYKEEFFKKLKQIPPLDNATFQMHTHGGPSNGQSKPTPSYLYTYLDIRYSIVKQTFNNITHDSVIIDCENFIPFKFMCERFSDIEIKYFNTVGTGGFVCFFYVKNIQKDKFLFELSCTDLTAPSELAMYVQTIGLDKFAKVTDGDDDKKGNKVKTRLLCYSANYFDFYNSSDYIKKVFDLDNKTYFEHDEPKNKIYLLSSQGFGGFKKTQYDIEPINSECLDYYEKDISDKSSSLLELINTKKKGIILFHGEKGCGKTSFIKYVINNSSKDFYYVNGEAAMGFSSGSFLEFIAANSKNAVFIFEDMEHLILSRETKSNNIISDILNASDGILSDILSPIFIFTFNTNVENIDSAFLRPGRLLFEQEFKKLSFIQAKKIAKKLKVKLKENKDYSLAEIFDEQNISVSSKNRSKTFSSEKSHAISGFLNPR